MNILFLCNSIGRQGTYFRWHNLAIGLTRLGHGVTVAAFDHTAPGRPARTEQRDGIEYHILGGNRGQSFFSQENHPLTALRGCLRNFEKFDVVHVFQPFLTAALPWGLRRPALAPVVIYDWDDLWAGGLLAAEPRGLAARWTQGMTSWLERTLPRRADHVTTCSAHLSRMAVERGARGSTVIPNGFWPAPYPTKSAARRQLGLRDDCLYVGFMGRTITGTELDWLAASLPVIAASGVPCRLAVCGLPEQLLISRVKAGRESLDYVGMLTPEMSRSFAAALDLGLLPLENAPLNHARFPIKFAEYLAAGAPVLSTPVGPCAELARDWPFVVTVGADQASWTQGLRETIERLGAGQFPPVDQTFIVQRLAWLSAAELVANLYRDVGKRIPLVPVETADGPGGRVEEIGRPRGNRAEASP